MAMPTPGAKSKTRCTGCPRGKRTTEPLPQWSETRLLSVVRYFFLSLFFLSLDLMNQSAAMGTVIPRAVIGSTIIKTHSKSDMFPALVAAPPLMQWDGPPPAFWVGCSRAGERAVGTEH